MPSPHISVILPAALSVTSTSSFCSGDTRAKTWEQQYKGSEQGDKTEEGEQVDLAWRLGHVGI